MLAYSFFIGFWYVYAFVFILCRIFCSLYDMKDNLLSQALTYNSFYISLWLQSYKNIMKGHLKSFRFIKLL